MGVATFTLVLPTQSAPRPEWHTWELAIGEPIALVAYSYPGFVVARQRPGNPIGWLLLVSGFGGLLDALGHAYTDYGYRRHITGVALSGWVSNWAFALNLFPLFLLLLAFPDAQLSAGRIRFAAWYVSACGLLVALSASVIPGPVDQDYYPTLENQFGISALTFLARYEGPLSFFLVACPFLLSAYLLLWRFRQSSGPTRQQFKWIAFAVLVDTVVAVGTFLVDRDAWFTAAVNLMLVVFSICLALAIVRHGLFDIDRLLNRSLVYLSLTGCVIGLHVGVVGLSGLLLRQSAPGLASLLSTGVVALALQPLRNALQKTASRVVYGLRDDPYAALAGLARRLEAVGAPARVLPEAAATVAEALHLPYVAVELDGPTRTGRVRAVTAAYGAEAPIALRFALSHQGTEIGALTVAARSTDERFSASDLRLLRDAALHIAQAAANVRLSLDVQHSQERAVAARAEERRHLAKALREGVGPALGDATGAVDAAATLVRTDPGRGPELLAAALERIREGTENLRRISMELRSPVDQLGLREAMLSYLDRVPLAVRITLPDDIPPLPAAVEEATYRILTEAMANALQRGQADGVHVSFELAARHITLTVTADGPDPPTVDQRVADLAPALELATQIGGTCEVRRSAGGGTECTARLPRRLPGSALPEAREAPPLQPGTGRHEGDRAGGGP
ncbi:sensor histidine kinase [Streptomyces spectabilis]|uniref:Signal transduction histidine kinase n=1 Tax=Streptomyces spectabilis TaxID=68270 RepID=A0A5P2XHW4_STRST|nr:hypothetical protein [Streptomyces spectabilis]MBB5102374.1 signal transduction histidine kinase [Streptomyces spectabilis]MCI3907419.1 hypothetical protein [Streptomyces spectabilis]QEV64131.1 hypothetical protein CP982_40080 [Streptomyces spectabilis]GGV30398.1 hypothetical protein GCM10010245_49480 [Streptomyces spectabilis]